MKKFSVQVKDFHDKFHTVERTVIVEAENERVAELHALQSLKGLKVNRELGSAYVPNGLVKVVKVKKIKEKKKVDDDFSDEFMTIG